MPTRKAPRRKKAPQNRRVVVGNRSPRDTQLAREEIDALLEALAAMAAEAEEPTGSRGRPRCADDYHRVHLLVRLAAMTGARIGELLALRARDVRKSGDTARVWLDREKGSREGFVFVGNQTAVDLLEEARAAEAEAFLFAATSEAANGAPITQKRLSKIMAEAFERAQIDLQGRQTWHALRHHAAWRTWELTHDLRDVQALLGHRSIQTVAAYLKLDDLEREERARAVVEGLHY